jgi:hypothetical protein
MANQATPQPVARVADDPTIRQLRELAAQEAAATKERLATRTAAARLFSGAVARVAETKAAWEHAQAEARRARARAVKDLVGSGMELGQVTELLGISKREVRSLGAKRPEKPRKAAGQRNGSVAIEAQRTQPAS